MEFLVNILGGIEKIYHELQNKSPKAQITFGTFAGLVAALVTTELFRSIICVGRGSTIVSAVLGVISSKFHQLTSLYEHFPHSHMETGFIGGYLLGLSLYANVPCH